MVEVCFLFRSKLQRNAKRCLPLFVLGGLKYFMTYLVDYHNHVSEYGTSWNFFMTMGFVQVSHFSANQSRLKYFCFDLQLICGSLTCFTTSKSKLALGLVTAGAAEASLTKWFYSWIFKLTLIQRQKGSYFLANSEGFISLIGFSSLFFFGAYFRSLINDLASPRHLNYKAKGLKFVLEFISQLHF